LKLKIKKNKNKQNGNIIVNSSNESKKKSGVDLEPWHYKMMSPETMF
jgi:hypothetical protein